MIIDGGVVAVIEPVAGKGSDTIDTNELSTMGIEVLAKSSHLLRVWIPLNMITEVLSAPGVGFVRRPLKPGKTQVQSEGMEQIGASGFHAFGYDGRGSKVAIIDSGFDGLSMAQARGELPTILQSIDFTQLGMEVNGPHGTACAVKPAVVWTLG